jgi:NAD(P)-dependent dehydrogenase (short-subunit alcohol dehydrogenase family)
MKGTAVSKVWFVTGASRGFGREFAEAALRRGDKVAATARPPESLNDLVDTYGDAVLPLRLDVTDREQVEAAVAAAQERFGRLDVIVNNAGYGLIGTFEEISEEQLRDQMETNLFGVFHLTRAVLPVLRQQRSGHIVQISTVGGITAFPLLGGYHAAKWTLEGMTASLAQDVADSGIKVTLVEPGAFSTDSAGSSATWAQAKPTHEQFREDATKRPKANPARTGDPKGVGQAILKVLDTEQEPLADTVKS